MIIDKALLKKFAHKCEELVEEIDEVANEVMAQDNVNEGETDFAEALWDAQRDVNNAKERLEEEF